MDGMPIYQTIDVISSQRQSSRQGTYNGAFCGSVSPWLIVTREHTEMAAANKLFVIQTQNGVVAIQKIWVEDNLDTIAAIVEELHPANLVENRIVGVVSHVMSHDRR